MGTGKGPIQILGHSRLISDHQGISPLVRPTNEYCPSLRGEEFNASQWQRNVGWERAIYFCLG